MGGQACVFYGAAEFSRDTDLAILARSENLERLQIEIIWTPLKKALLGNSLRVPLPEE